MNNSKKAFAIGNAMHPACGSLFIYASNEPKSVLARDLGDCRVNQNWFTGPIIDMQSNGPKSVA